MATKDTFDASSSNDDQRLGGWMIRRRGCVTACFVILLLGFLVDFYCDINVAFNLPSNLYSSSPSTTKMTMTTSSSKEGVWNQSRPVSSGILQDSQKEPSSSSSSGENATTTTKYFVMHLGPPKTATTQIQKMASSHQGLLMKDNYFYDGVRKNGPLKDVLQSKYKCRNEVAKAYQTGQPYPACWQETLHELDANINHNVFFSSENLRYLSHATKKEYFLVLEEALRQRGYELIFVIAYRRLFEVVVSGHTQNNRGSPNNRNWIRWPAQGGLGQKPLFPEVMTNSFINTTHGVPRGTWTATLLNILPETMNIKLLNMYQAAAEHKTVEIQLFCEVLPQAPAICDYVKKAHAAGTMGAANPSTPIWYDLLALEAADHGMVNTDKYTRLEVTAAIEKHQVMTMNRTSLDFPWRCPPEADLQQIYDMSLYWEHKFFPDMRDDEGFRASFQHSVDKKKFCDLDTEATLDMKEWKDFFSEHYAD